VNSPVNISAIICCCLFKSEGQERKPSRLRQDQIITAL
jgi:hypothetical protein